MVDLVRFSYHRWMYSIIYPTYLCFNGPWHLTRNLLSIVGISTSRSPNWNCLNLEDKLYTFLCASCGLYKCCLTKDITFLLFLSLIWVISCTTPNFLGNPVTCNGYCHCYQQVVSPCTYTTCRVLITGPTPADTLLWARVTILAECSNARA